MKLSLLSVAAVGITLQLVVAQDTAELVHHSVDSDGHPVAVWEKSPGSPRGVIVLIHGRTWSGLPDFDLQVPGEELSLMDGLVKRGYTTYAVDLRGYGGTRRDETGWLSPNRAAADVANVLRWVWETTGRTERPVLFGWSLGSMVSQLTVQQEPELASAVVLFGYPFTPGTETPIRDDSEHPPRTPTTAEAAASDFITEGSISQTAIDTYVRAALEADPVRVDWNRGHEWNALEPGLVVVPTLLLQGEFDPLATTERQLSLFTQLGTSDKSWVVIPGGDHAAHLETPRDYFIAALVEFIERPR